ATCEDVGEQDGTGKDEADSGGKEWRDSGDCDADGEVSGAPYDVDREKRQNEGQRVGALCNGCGGAHRIYGSISVLGPCYAAWITRLLGLCSCRSSYLCSERNPRVSSQWVA